MMHNDSQGRIKKIILKCVIGLLAFAFGGCGVVGQPVVEKTDVVSQQVMTIVASQYAMQEKSVDLDRHFRDYGRENGMQDELNYVEVIQRAEKVLHIQLPDEVVMDKAKVGLELIPVQATPRWLIGVARQQVAARHN